MKWIPEKERKLYFCPFVAKLKVNIDLARNRTGVLGLSVAIMDKGKLIFAEGFGKRNNKKIHG